MSEVADGVRVVSMVRNQAIPSNLEVDGYQCKVSYYGQAKECDICKKTGHITKDCPFRGKCLRCGQDGHLYCDCRTEPVAATTPGPRGLPVDPEDNRTGEAMESDSSVNCPVPPVEFVPASIVSSDGFMQIRRRAKGKRARIFESNDIGNVDNCLVNDNNGDTASSENGETVDVIIDDVNSDSNNIVSGQASNSSVANHSTVSMNDSSINNNISCDISHTSNVNSSKDNNNVSSCVRGTRTQPLICVGCSVHCWVSCAINNGSFFEISFSSSSTLFCLAFRRLVTFCLTLTN